LADEGTGGLEGKATEGDEAGGAHGGSGCEDPGIWVSSRH